MATKKKENTTPTPTVEPQESAWGDYVMQVLRTQGFRLEPKRSPGLMVYRRPIFDGSRQYLIEAVLESDDLCLTPRALIEFRVYYAVTVAPDASVIAGMREGPARNMLTLLTAQLDASMQGAALGAKECSVCKEMKTDWVPRGDETSTEVICGSCLTFHGNSDEEVIV